MAFLARVSWVAGLGGPFAPPFPAAPPSEIRDSNFSTSSRLESSLSLSFSCPRLTRWLSQRVPPPAPAAGQSEPRRARLCVHPSPFRNRHSFLIYSIALTEHLPCDRRRDLTVTDIALRWSRNTYACLRAIKPEHGSPGPPPQHPLKFPLRHVHCPLSPRPSRYLPTCRRTWAEKLTCTALDTIHSLIDYPRSVYDETRALIDPAFVYADPLSAMLSPPRAPSSLKAKLNVTPDSSG